MNVRFWIWALEGFVKLTMRPGQQIDFATGGRHDEGWSRSGSSFYYDASGFIRRIEWSDGTDCDGRFATEAEYVATVLDVQRTRPETWEAQLNECDPTREPLFIPVRPDWTEEAHFQRDYAAEAAGY